jgi:putative redox protein
MSADKTVVPFVIQGDGNGVAQRVKAEGSAGHVFEADAFPAFGGRDAAPSPLFYALGALSACNQVTASLVAKSLGLTLGNFHFEVQGDLDIRVLVHGASGNANFDSVRVDVSVETDADEEQFARFVSETERRCPVTQLFQRSGLHYHSQWQRKALGQVTAAE